MTGPTVAEHPAEEVKRWLLDQWQGRLRPSEVNARRAEDADGRDAWYFMVILPEPDRETWNADDLAELRRAVRDKALEVIRHSLPGGSDDEVLGAARYVSHTSIKQLCAWIAGDCWISSLSRGLGLSSTPASTPTAGRAWPRRATEHRCHTLPRSQPSPISTFLKAPSSTTEHSRPSPARSGRWFRPARRRPSCVRRSSIAPRISTSAMSSFSD